MTERKISEKCLDCDYYVYNNTIDYDPCRGEEEPCHEFILARRIANERNNNETR